MNTSPTAATASSPMTAAFIFACLQAEAVPRTYRRGGSTGVGNATKIGGQAARTAGFLPAIPIWLQARPMDPASARAQTRGCPVGTYPARRGHPWIGGGRLSRPLSLHAGVQVYFHGPSFTTTKRPLMTTGRNFDEVLRVI
jgi:hypothetical protein